jgi:hypothetical protein
MDIELEEAENWSKLRAKLKDGYKINANWNAAINLYGTRINRKFFDPLQWIINHEKLKGEGFTIVAVQCALIESFAAFRVGQIFNHKKKGEYPRYEYKSSSTIFVDFLNSAAIFKGNFYEINSSNQLKINTPFSAESFYAEVRCGLLHEARTKGNWIINAKKGYVPDSQIFLEKSGKHIKIWRTILHYRLKQYLVDYIKDLQSDTAEAEALRRLFARKLDHLFNIDADPSNFEWWEDR